MSIKAREADTCFTFFITTYIVQSRQGYNRSRTALSSLKLRKSLLIKLNLSLKSYDYFKCSFSKFKFFFIVTWCSKLMWTTVVLWILMSSFFYMVTGCSKLMWTTVVLWTLIISFLYSHMVFQVDVDHSGTLDFDEFFDLLTSMMSSWEPAEDLGTKFTADHCFSILCSS